MMQNRKWWGLGALMPAMAMIFADQSILPVALPTIQKELSVSDVQLQWMVNAYLLTMAVLVLAGGKAVDRMGYRRGFCLGMILFALTSVSCALSYSAAWMIVSRVGQGVGAALMIPSSMAIQMKIFPASERGKATGINVSISSFFLIVGPLLGGFFTQYLSWRWSFWINIPLTMVSLSLVWAFIPSFPKGEGKIDFWGFLIFAFTCSLLIVSTMQGAEWGWLSWAILGSNFSFLVGVFLLLWREKRAKHPFLDLSLFRHSAFKAANISIFSSQFILMITVFWAIYFQKALHYSPLDAGVITFVSSIPVMFMAPVAGRISDRFGPKIPIAIGFLLLTYSFFWIGFFSSAKLSLLLPGLIAFGIGTPFILTPSYATAIHSIPPTKMGIAYGIIATLRNMAASLGVATIGTAIHSLDIKMPQIESFAYVNFGLGFLLIAAFAIVFTQYRRIPNVIRKSDLG